MCQYCIKKSRLKNKPLLVFIGIGLLSMIWFLLRTGKKPDRLRYPCQQVAATNSILFLIWLGSIFSGHVLYRKFLKPNLVLKSVGIILLIFLFILGYKGFKIDILNRISWAGDFDHAAICPGGNCATWPNPLVVSIRNTNAITSSSISNCPSPYTASTCYFSDNQVNQTVVNQMLDQGIMILGETNNVASAWSKLFINKFGADYQTGKKVGIKINFNNSAGGYGMPSRYNPLPQTVVALLRQLRDEAGIAEENIYLYDCSRAFYTYFTDNIYQKGFTKIHYVGTRIDSAYPVVKEMPRQGSLLKLTPYSDMYICAQVEDTFDYIINMPLLRPHGGAGVTLGFKNHLGSFYTGASGYGIDNLHTAIYTPGSGINTSHPLVQLNGITANGFSAIRDKTLLTLADGLYSHNNNNTDPPNVIYESLILAQDPVAADSVILDHLRTFSSKPTVVSQNYLHAAAQTDLGVHEHWNADKKYSEINHIYCDPNCLASSPQPSASGSPAPSIFSPGDVNHDGVVDILDGKTIINNYAKNPGQVANFFEQIIDYKINFLDYGVWIKHYLY